MKKEPLLSRILNYGLITNMDVVSYFETGNFNWRRQADLVDPRINPDWQEPMAFVDRLKAPNCFNPETRLLNAVVGSELIKLLMHLEPEEALILIKHYGLDGEPALDQQDISEILGVSDTWVSLRCTSAKNKLKDLISHNEIITKELSVENQNRSYN